MIRTGNEKTGNSLLNIPVKAGQTLTECTIAVINAEGYAETATKAVGKIVAGCVQRFCDNATGADGAATVEVKRGHSCGRMMEPSRTLSCSSLAISMMT